MHVPRRLDHRLFPLVCSPVLGLLGLLEAGADPEFRASFGVVALVSAWIAGAFLVQARFPAVGAVLVGGFFPVTVLLEAPGPGGAGLIAAMLAMGYAGYAAPRQRSLVAVTVAVLLFVVTDAIERGIGWDTVFFPAVFYPAWWAGRLVARERERSAQLVELTAQLEAQREAEVRAIAQEERGRIARDVHDAVAHSVSVMTLQLGGLRRQLEPALSDRPAEREVMLGLERLGRQTVEELRSLVGILRETGEDSPTAPVPSLARVEELVGDVRAAGHDVELEVSGEPGALPRALDLTAYRILQEALTNVLRHAPGSRARVSVCYRTDALELRVRDSGAAAAAVSRLPRGQRGGHGITGMRERARMFGGSLQAGPADQGFEIRVVLPVRGRVS